MKAFVNTLKVKPPSTIACYNAGVSILVYGTCLDYYGIKAGVVSNMLDIIHTLGYADPPVRP